MIEFGAGIAGGIVLSLGALWLASLGMRVRIGGSSIEQFTAWREVMRFDQAKKEAKEARP